MKLPTVASTVSIHSLVSRLLHLDQTEYIAASFSPIQLIEGSTQTFYIDTTGSVWLHKGTGETIEDDNVKISVSKEFRMHTALMLEI